MSIHRNGFLQAHAEFLSRLTDEVSRHNFELFGHPDGKQEFSQGIALPSWVVESSNKWYVMAAYALILGVLLPVLVVSQPPVQGKQCHS